MHASLHVILALVAFWLISGTLLNFSKHPHWYIRGWDFPRVFTAAISAALLVLYAIFFSTGPWWNVVVMAGLVWAWLGDLHQHGGLSPRRVRCRTPRDSDRCSAAR